MFGVFGLQLKAEIEAFHLHLVMATYGYNTPESGSEELCTVVLTMVTVTCREILRVWVEAEMDYGSEPLAIMVGQYLRETLQAYMWIDEFISDKIYQHPDVALNKILYLF